MPLLNLNSASGVRFNGKLVSTVRLNGVDIWTDSVPPATQYSMWATPPVEPIGYVDADPGSWLANQFYIPPASTLELSVKAIRLYVPPASILIGQPGRFAFQKRAFADGGIWTTTEGLAVGMDAVGTDQPFPQALVAGWNVFPFTAPFTISPGDGVLLGYTIGASGTGYLFDTTLSELSILDHTGLGLYLSEVANRSNYRKGWTTARWYGIDLLVEPL